MPKNYPDIPRPSVKPDFTIPIERDLGINYNCKIKVQNSEGEPIPEANVFIEILLTEDTFLAGKTMMGTEGITNEDGYVLFNTTDAFYIVTINANDYQDYVKTISIKKNELITIKLDKL